MSSWRCGRAVSYKRLFHLLINRESPFPQLRQMTGYSTNISTRLRNNTQVSLESLEKVCRVLDCTLDNIRESAPEKEKKL